LIESELTLLEIKKDAYLFSVNVAH